MTGRFNLPPDRLKPVETEQNDEGWAANNARQMGGVCGFSSTIGEVQQHCKVKALGFGGECICRRGLPDETEYT